MNVVALGQSGLNVSDVCLGTMTFGTPDWGCDEDEAGRIVGAFLDAGGTFFDCADVYAGGRSEEILGRAIRGHRDEVVIATKVGSRTGPGPDGEGASRAHIVGALDASLRRLGTDHIDLYQLHHHDDATPIQETLDVLTDCVRAGKIRHAGCSNFFAWQIAEANVIADQRSDVPFVSSQMMYNLVRRDLEREYFRMASERGLALITYSPLHAGILAGTVERDVPPPPDARVAAHPLIREVYLGDEERAWSVVDAVRWAADKAGSSMSAIALGWVFRQPAITSVLVGARSVEELQANLRARELDVDDAIWQELDARTAPPSTYPTDFYERLRRRAELGRGPS